MGVSGERDGCAASRMWRSACTSLAAPSSEEAWQQVVGASPSDTLWHSLRNCVSYQAGIWQSLLLKGITDVQHAPAFKLAIVLRHTPSELTVRLLTDLLHLHPNSQELTAYILALLTDDEAWCGNCAIATGGAASRMGTGAALRDLQLFGDCELAVLAASREEYDAHAKLVRAEYCTMARQHYVELRVKVLNQFSQTPKIYHTPEFECLEGAARENIDREIATLREHLLTVTMSMIDHCDTTALMLANPQRSYNLKEEEEHCDTIVVADVGPSGMTTSVAVTGSNWMRVAGDWPSWRSLTKVYVNQCTDDDDDNDLDLQSVDSCKANTFQNAHGTTN